MLRDGDRTASVEPLELSGSWLGMSLVPADSWLAAQLGVPPNAQGVVVTDVSSQVGSRALQAGVAPGDLLTSVDGKEIGNLTDLARVASVTDIARQVPLELVRAGQSLVLALPSPVPLKPTGPVQPVAAYQMVPAAPYYGPGLGLRRGGAAACAPFGMAAQPAGANGVRYQAQNPNCPLPGVAR
jgi:membrane-associated protease RseP (regulator of RpoE activity)